MELKTFVRSLAWDSSFCSQATRLPGWLAGWLPRAQLKVTYENGLPMGSGLSEPSLGVFHSSIEPNLSSFAHHPSKQPSELVCLHV